MPEADPGLARVRLDVAESLHRQPEAVAGDLLVSGLVALAVGFCADPQLDGAVGGKANLGSLLRGTPRRLKKA